MALTVKINTDHACVVLGAKAANPKITAQQITAILAELNISANDAAPAILMADLVAEQLKAGTLDPPTVAKQRAKRSDAGKPKGSRAAVPQTPMETAGDLDDDGDGDTHDFE